MDHRFFLNRIHITFDSSKYGINAESGWLTLNRLVSYSGIVGKNIPGLTVSQPKKLSRRNHVKVETVDTVINNTSLLYRIKESNAYTCV